jgi:hypothetical protein
MADPTLGDLESRMQEPDSDPQLQPSDDSTERYFQTLKRFLSDAKKAKNVGVPGAKQLWEFARLEVLNSAIEDVEGALNPFGRAARIGKALGQAAMNCKPAIDSFMAERSANAVDGRGHANPDIGGAAVHALLGTTDWITTPVNRAIANLSINDVKSAIKAPFLEFRYRFRQHDYLGCAEEALSYFARAKSYYDRF